MIRGSLELTCEGIAKSCEVAEITFEDDAKPREAAAMTRESAAMACEDAAMACEGAAMTHESAAMAREDAEMNRVNVEMTHVAIERVRKCKNCLKTRRMALEAAGGEYLVQSN